MRLVDMKRRLFRNLNRVVYETTESTSSSSELVPI